MFFTQQNKYRIKNLLLSCSTRMTHPLKRHCDRLCLENQAGNGSVAERSKALVLGTSLIEAWVRIPPLPRGYLLLKFCRVWKDCTLAAKGPQKVAKCTE